MLVIRCYAYDRFTSSGTFLVAYAVSCDGGDPSPSSEFQQTLRAIREVLVALEGVEVGSMSASVTAVLYE